MLLTAFLIAGLVFGLYMAWNIGANDVANAMGTSVGSRALSLKQALVVAAVFEFAGALFAGSHVTETVKKGIVDVDKIPDAFVFVLVMLAALLSAGIWLQFATWKGLPVSTSHSIVGGVAGAGVAAAGIGGVQWSKLAWIATSWVLSPLIGGAIAFVMFRFVSGAIINHPSPRARVRRYSPLLAGLVLFVLVLSLLYKGLANLDLDLSMARALPLSLGVGIAGALLAVPLFGRVRDAPAAAGRYGFVERHFGWLQVMTACYVAFAHGANDVANSVGPLAGIVAVWQTGAIGAKVGIPVWLLAFGGFGIVVGLATWGYRVMETIGKRITELTPSRGFSAEFAAATTVLVCTKLSLPISTTHTLVGAVVGIGLARGIAALDMRVMRDILSAWVVTLPVAFLLAAALYWGLAAIFL